MNPPKPNGFERNYGREVAEDQREHYKVDYHYQIIQEEEEAYGAWLMNPWWKRVLIRHPKSNRLFQLW